MPPAVGPLEGARGLCAGCGESHDVRVALSLQPDGCAKSLLGCDLQYLWDEFARVDDRFAIEAQGTASEWDIEVARRVIGSAQLEVGAS